MNPRMPMMPQPHANMMHQMHPNPNQGGQGGPAGPQVSSQGGQANSPMGHSPMNAVQSPMGGNAGPHNSPLHTNSPMMKNPAKSDDYNLDFLDSIPAGNESNENNGKSSTDNDDLMTLLDS